ncbi:MAG: TetR family transcriptional regulator [Planctomycetota bacterium]
MNRLSRDIFVERTRELLARQGCTDVSLSNVLTACDANKGSLYHFFPKGKDELVVAAIQKQAEFAIAVNQDFLTRANSTAEAVFQCLESLAKKMAASLHRSRRKGFRQS